MEPLSVQCTTCGSRLRVRNPRLVGQIIACPKCQAMVMVGDRIQQPGIAVGLGEVDSEALTQEKIEPGGLAPQQSDRSGDGESVEKGAAGAPAVKSHGWQSDGPLQVDAENQIKPPNLPHGSDLPLEGLVPPLPTETKEIPGVDRVIDDPSDGVPPVAWQSESSARIRAYAAVAVIGLIGVLLASGAFVVVIRQWSDAGEQVSLDSNSVAQTSPDRPASAEDRSTPEGDVEQKESGPASTHSAVAANPDKSTDQSSIKSETSNSSEAFSPESLVDNSDDRIIEGGEKDSTAKPSADLGAVAISDANKKPGLPAGDPLFPEVVIGEASDDKAKDGADTETTAEAFPPSLAQYMRVIVEAKPDAAIPQATEPAPAAMDQLKVQFPQMLVADTEFPPPAKPIDVRARGEMRIVGLKADDQPMDQLLRVIGQASGIPIQLELMSFDVVGRSVDHSVSIRAKDTNAASVLAAVAQGAGCVLSLEDDGIVRVHPSQVEVETAVAKACELRDFGGKLPFSEEKLRQLAGIKPGAEVRVENGRVTIEADMDSAIRAALALETIRFAMGIEPRLDASRIKRWISDLTLGEGSDPAVVDWSPIADHKVGFNEDREYGLELVLGDLAADAGAALVLDWESCWSHGLTPDAKALPWFRDKKTHEVFQQVLKPYGLQSYDVGTGVFWVGTQEAYEQMPIWAVLEAGGKPELAMQRIADAVGVPIDQTAAWLSEPSGKIVVYLPRFVVRQLPNLLAR